MNSVTVKEGIEKIKANKSDPIHDFSSDFLKNAPDILYEHLAIVIKAFVVHEHVTESLLLATLVPIVKDKFFFKLSINSHKLSDFEAYRLDNPHQLRSPPKEQ